MNVNNEHEGRKCPGCLRATKGGILYQLDIPSAQNLLKCGFCHRVFRPDEVGGFDDVTVFIERLAAGDDRVLMAVSDEHRVTTEGIMELITGWRARSEMDVLSLIGSIQQRLCVLDNRLHSIKGRLAASLLGEPTPLETNEILELVDECIDLASPAPARERGIKQDKNV
ncbi:hypothetical protein LCGC14_1525620 [marine sediment metagenome]|uniref:Uncharacterized protein n=1 Tax=marine sediment metagenome TaxID=412755 RepID=A0A0F9IX92_9ZZZZ